MCRVLNFGAHWGVIGGIIEQLMAVLRIPLTLLGSAKEFRLEGDRDKAKGTKL